ncbi:MAG: DNA-3-methyladenine glycosylase [Verrucomicrobiota bacterium]
MKKALTAKFFQRDALVVARELLGKVLCRRLPDGSLIRLPLTEVEAYLGPEDLACHASKGKTPRTAVMFEPGGINYVYLCYGMHWMLNFVTGPAGHPAAVLVRGIGHIRGPGRVTKVLAVDKALNAQATKHNQGLWVEDDTLLLGESDIVRTPRIGIGYAGEPWIDAPLRLVVSDDWWKRVSSGPWQPSPVR